MQQNSFGDWLKHRRKALDLTQAELANQVGCSAAAIRKIEAEERRPSAQIARRFAEIFNIPSAEQASFMRFARGEVRSAPAKTQENFPWQTSPAVSRSNIPVTVTSLIGRAQEIVDVREYLLHANIRLVTLIGPPGIGKTRLSIETARSVLQDFPDGVFFIPLVPLEDPSLIVLTIAQALSFVEMNRQSATEQLIDGIRDKQMLLILDNCEHLIEGVASLASRLLSACPRLKILATTRESLRIPGEWIYTVPVLDVPAESSPVDIGTVSNFPALTLFAERARAVRSDFALDEDNIQPVTAICAHLDGLPLAIELMAARMRLMTPQSLLEHLNHEFVLSADGMRTSSPRQKTLNDAIAWSYNLLSDEEQRLFAFLSVFSGGFTLEAAQEIFSKLFTDMSVSALVASLLDKSLLQRLLDSKGEIRFNMLVTIQQFARNHLQSMGNETEARNLHLIYFLGIAEYGDKEIHGPNQIEWVQRLSSIRDNLRAALDWAIKSGQTELALRLVRKLDWFWFVRSDHTEGRQWLERVLEMPEAPLYPDAQAEALSQVAHHTWLQIGHKEARPFVEKALSIARTHADKHNRARGLAILGLILTDEKSFPDAQTSLRESQEIYRELYDEWGYAHAVLCLGQVFHEQGDLSAALRMREEALQLFRKVGDRYFESVTLTYIGMYQAKQGKIAKGTDALKESLQLAQQLDSKYDIAMILRYFAEVAQAGGYYPSAVRLYWASKKIYDSIGAWHQEHELNFENTLVACRATLNEAEFAETVEQGRAMTMEQAIAYALELSPGA
jgi:predicted ATPase/DNA-binding XRE family transcriptional regulator